MLFEWAIFVQEYEGECMVFPVRVYKYNALISNAHQFIWMRNVHRAGYETG